MDDYIKASILQGLCLSRLQVEPVEDGVREVAHCRAHQQSEGVVVRFGECECVAA
jgi:hypothetical protein